MSCGLVQVTAPVSLSLEHQPYNYHPITQEARFRLLHIHPGEGDEPVRGELVNVSINERHSCETVSYT